MSDALTELRGRIAELEQLFDLRHAADVRAVQQWRKGHPERALRMPDHADMVCWLLNENEQLRHALAQRGEQHAE